MIGSINIPNRRSVNGNFNINGKIVKYQAKELIDIGDFIEAVNGTKVSTDTLLSTETILKDSISVAKLSTTRIFITFINTQNKLYGAICTVSNNTIVVNKITQIYTNITKCKNVALSEQKVCIMYENSEEYVRMSVITIADNLQIGTYIDIELGTQGFDIIALSNTDICIAFVYAQRLYVSTYNVNGSTITQLVKKQISTSWGNQEVKISLVKISQNKICSFANASSNKQFQILEINGEIITTKYTNFENFTFSGSKEISTVKISENKVLVIYQNNNYLCGKIYTISDTTMTGGTEIQLNIRERWRICDFC